MGKLLADSSRLTRDGVVNITNTQGNGVFMLRDEFSLPLHHINWKGNWERRSEEKGTFPV